MLIHWSYWSQSVFLQTFYLVKHLNRQTVCLDVEPLGEVPLLACWFRPSDLPPCGAVPYSLQLSFTFRPSFSCLTLWQTSHLCPVSPGSCTRPLANWLPSVTSTSCCQRTAVGKEPHSSQPWAVVWGRSWTANRKSPPSQCYVPSTLAFPTPHLPHPQCLLSSWIKPVQSSHHSSCFSLCVRDTEKRRPLCCS